MIFIFEDIEILNLDLSEFANTNFYSNIVFKNQSLLERIKESIDSKFQFEVQTLAEVKENEECIIWTSNVVFVDSLKQSLFLEKLYYSHGSYKWSNGNGFIFRGTKKKFDSSKYTNLKLEDYHLEIKNFSSYQNLLETSIDTRHFNKIEKSSNGYTKKSKDIKKIEKEFEFLSSIPAKLKPFYVDVHSFKKTPSEAQYSMPRISYLDVSRRHINGDISRMEAETLFEQLTIYFEKAIEIGHKKTGKEYDFISDKTEKRIENFIDTGPFNKINSLFQFSSNSKNLNTTFEELNFLLKRNKKNINKKGSLVSHGDLCFSNILSSKDFRNLIFIDPMGGSLEESTKSIYYDFAKLSHSILGNYDFIIHGLADFKFNNEMELFVSYKKEENIYLQENFMKLLDRFNLDIGITRLIEASLFLSMLPLHTESLNRTAMLAYRGYEILNKINEDNLI